MLSENVSGISQGLFGSQYPVVVLGHGPLQFVHVVGLLGPGFFQHALHGIELALSLHKLLLQCLDIRQRLLFPCSVG